MESILKVILTVPIVFLFKTMQKGLHHIFVGNEDKTTFLNYLADELVENNYILEEVIVDVFDEINVKRTPPSWGECGYRCDGHCKTCLQYNGRDSSGLSWNESGYND